jgi:glyoxylase-like metal-dependent hydrolase (beta-lactamase superfamily II)
MYLQIVMAAFTQLTRHIWIIHGYENSRFPSGNALLIRTMQHIILVDTNPGFSLINSTIKDILGTSSDKITDIVLSHTHLDHARGLADLFEISHAKIHAHPDTLKRCERMTRVGLYAGIPKNDVHYFEEFGKSIGFRDYNYPLDCQHPIYDGEILQFDAIQIKAHETFAHCVHMLDFEIIDGDIRMILSCDFDFSPLPWYGVPQRGESIEMFKKATAELCERKPTFIVSSHRIDPIAPSNFSQELILFNIILENRTTKIINLLKNHPTISLRDIRDFVYPIDKMHTKFSDAYIACAQWWDWWLALAHLEKAWIDGKAECIDPGHDPFLIQCIEEQKYHFRSDNERKGLEWAKLTLDENPPWEIPLKSVWRLE